MLNADNVGPIKLSFAARSIFFYVCRSSFFASRYLLERSFACHSRAGIFWSRIALPSAETDGGDDSSQETVVAKM
jgi:hypothetical protein